MSEEKFSKCEEKGGRKKIISVEFRVFGKKKEKFRRRKKSKCFGRNLKWKILLSSYLLLGFLLFDSSITWANWKVKVAVAEKKKSGIFIYWVRTHSLGAMLRMTLKLLKMLGVTLWTNQKLGAMLWTNLGNLKSDFIWDIHLRLYSGPFGCRVPG